MTVLQNILKALYARLQPVVPGIYVMRQRPFELAELPAANLLIAGEEAGSKLDKALSLGIETMDESAFVALIDTFNRSEGQTR
jgi:hypothetical protein